MRKLAFLSLLVISAAAAHAQVVACPGPFPTAAQMKENFDLIPSGSYNSAPIWQSPIAGNVFALNPPGTVDILPPPFWQPPALSLPNTCVGTATDLGLTVSPVMRRFGGWFRNMPNTTGVAPTFAKVVFVDASGVVIGSVGIPLTNTWTWFGWKVNPKFYEVDIYSSLPYGGVELDDIEVRPV